MSNLQKEIRIGNYLLGKVEDELDERKVYWEEYQVKDSDDFAGIRDDWDKPIPLTEEWLVKFGGEKIPHFTISNSITIKTKRNQQLSFGCVGSPNFMIFLQEIDSDDDRKISDLIPIHNWDYDGEMYVHQLQNLFYALVGEELTIKEKENG